MWEKKKRKKKVQISKEWVAVLVFMWCVCVCAAHLLSSPSHSWGSPSPEETLALSCPPQAGSPTPSSAFKHTLSNAGLLGLLQCDFIVQSLCNLQRIDVFELKDTQRSDLDEAAEGARACVFFAGRSRILTDRSHGGRLLAELKSHYSKNVLTEWKRLFLNNHKINKL